MKKKPAFLFPLSVIGLLVMGLFVRLIASAYPLVPQLSDAHWIVHLILPLGLMGTAIAFHITAKGRTAGYLISYLCNAMGSGCAVGAIFGLRGYTPPPELLAALVPAVLICAMGCLVPLIPNELWEGIAQLVLTALAVVLLIAGIFIWPLSSMPLGCCFLFSGLFILPFPIAVSNARQEPKQQFRYLSFSGFGAFILIITVAAFILSDGEILDGFDIGDFGGSSKKKGK